VPLIVFHGDGDPTVDHVNAAGLIDGRLRAGGAPSAGYRHLTHTGQVPHGRGYTRDVFTDGAGASVIEQWRIHEGKHAWAGGSPHGSYTDPLGPDASAELVRFFLQHTSVAGSRSRPRRRRAALPA
jgi:poly(3-hydroxybutyrate) depolymerase